MKYYQYKFIYDGKSVEFSTTANSIKEADKKLKSFYRYLTCFSLKWGPA